jgi:hypothetical protein
MSIQLQILNMVNFQLKHKKIGFNVAFMLPLSFDELNFFQTFN